MTWQQTFGDVLSWVTWLYESHTVKVTLVAVMILDILMGCMLAAFNWELNSTASFKGMCRKGGIFCMTGLGYALQKIVPNYPVGDLTALLFTVSEAISVLENGVAMGLPVPEPIAIALEKARDGDKSSKRRIFERRATRKQLEGGVRVDSVIIDSRNVKVNKKKSEVETNVLHDDGE